MNRSVSLSLLLIVWPIGGAIVRLDARDLYVDNVIGDDRRDGMSSRYEYPGHGPVRTIGRALRIAENGDRVVLAKTDEPYHESVTLQADRNSGIATRPFVIVGNGATLDGQRSIPEEKWEGFRGDIFRFQPQRLAHQNLFIDRRPLTEVKVGRHQKIPDLQALEWCLHEGYVYFRCEPGRIPSSYSITHTALSVGITLYEVKNVEIYDLIVQGFSLDGINAHDSVFGGAIIGVTSRGNGRSGISIGGASRVTVEACLVGNNREAQVRTEGFSRTRIVNSTLIEDPHAPAVRREGGLVERPEPQ